MRKVYYTENVKQKTGRVCPITKVKFVKDCPVCGLELELRIVRKGTLAKRAIKVFEHKNNKTCKYREMAEGDIDRAIRIGAYDKEIMLKTRIEK